MSKFLKRKVNTVFLMLGNSCNMNCRYCLQHPLVTKQLASEVNPDIYKFLEELSEDVPEGQKLHIQFYGGEPLLYFETIKEVVAHTGDFCCFSVISNGKAITKEMVDLFNENQIPITISWDGRNVLKTRGFDVFAPTSPQRELLLSIKQLGLTAVMSSFAYPKEILESFQELSNDYFAIHGYHVSMNIDEVFDTGALPQDLLEINFDRVENEMYDLAKEYIHILTSNKPLESKSFITYVYLQRLFNNIQSFYLDGNGEYKRSYCACGNGYHVLNLDLSGKLYACHNTSTSIGSIYDNYFSYLTKLLASDPTLENKDVCGNCPAVAFCQGGCKLVDEERRRKGYCELKKAVFLPVLTAVEQYGSLLPKDDSHGS